MGGEKRRKVANKESSTTEYLEQPESSSMGSTREHLDSWPSQPERLRGDFDPGCQQVVPRRRGQRDQSKPMVRRELIDLTGEDGAGSVPRFGGEVIDLTEEPSEEGEDKLRDLGGRDGHTKCNTLGRWRLH
jgi:hypothetical protein